MERVPVESQALSSVGYDPAQRVLEVEFSSGEVYRYFNVPENEYVALMEADSFGLYFIENVRKRGYRFHHVG
ncbi:KTSC domain-containing protein [Lysobacter korlensis]|uniref:KTSC domain-containing protein n=1 Tax=Lysobacter korlensis TaxID=553636 RepID=A0ABV6RQQ5_9GAMM